MLPVQVVLVDNKATHGTELHFSQRATYVNIRSVVVLSALQLMANGRFPDGNDNISQPQEEDY